MFEKSVKQFKIDCVKEPPQVKQLQDYIVQNVQAERDAKWVTMLEEVVNIVPVAMVIYFSPIYFFDLPV